MQIKIAGYPAASLLLEREPDRWNALIILGAGIESSGYVETRAPTCVYLSFDDLLAPRSGMILPTQDVIKQGLAFAAGKARLLVSCRAGQGRSAALGYLIACQDRGPIAAITLLDPTRHTPNRLVVALGASILGDVTILDRFDAWRRRNADVRLSDHYDAIEAEFDELERSGAKDLITRPV